MDVIDAVKSAFQRYFDFQGRSRRAEFWYFIAFGVAGLCILPFFDGLLFDTSAPPEAGPWSSFGFNVRHGPLSILFIAVMFIPWVSVSARRLHDIGRNGWWILFGFVPPIGWLFMLIWLTRDSLPEENEYGTDPLAGEGIAGHA
ncbi:MAG: DUF805 domain-containing protein [Kordiimonadaceae bacterium]|nr:DUF805 domain-containing protein [Kordiimonadaceae bacterium]MBO6569516.1 DUF805 domain-containing protein [Kordiimonadaceae bacterium]MBO6964991.1 DUF805 domain-containing protein [Kordiimonadaceae bacterium]